MHTWIILYLLVAAVAFGMSLLITPLCMGLARKLDFLDRPLGEMHKKHAEPIPLMGGLALFLSWALTLGGGLLVVFLSGNQLPPEVVNALPGIRGVLPQLGGLALAALALTVLGLADDRKPMGPMVKLVGQILICGAAAMLPNLRITLFWHAAPITWFLTLGWFLLIVNAFNFFDNMDGLAAGMAVICAGLFAIAAGFREQYFVATLAAVIAGCAAGFYCYNRNPARMFMGDAGSHFLGFSLAALGALVVFYDPSSTHSVVALLIPLLVLALPIFDAFAVIVIRLRAGTPIYRGDHNHISHRFVHMGLSRKVAVLVVHFLALAIGLGALSLLWLHGMAAILVLLQAAAILAVISILHFYLTDA